MGRMGRITRGHLQSGSESLSIHPPDRKIQHARKRDPHGIRHQKKSSHPVNRTECADGQQNEHEQDKDFDKRPAQQVQAEE